MKLNKLLSVGTIFKIDKAQCIAYLQVQPMLSFYSTILGTVMRIPCEVLKQRLQAGLYDNVAEALVGTWRKDGLGGFFRGTGTTLCREVPFYVAGMGLYDESKKVCSFHDPVCLLVTF